jgi:predicted outer membrane lipoprotein
MQDETCGFLSKMIARKLGNMVQAVIFAGLLIAGTMYAFGLGGDPKWWVVPGGYLAWFFGLLSVIFYIIAVPIAIYRDTARKFWGGWCPLNFGLTLFGTTLTFTRIESSLVLAWPCLLGVGVAVALLRWHAVTSRYVLILVNVLLLAPTLPFLARYWEVLVLPLATAFVIVPALYAASVDTVIRPRDARPG